MELKVTKSLAVLFQSDSTTNENKYMKLLEQEGINAKNISTLSFNFINEEKLKSCLLNADDYSGIIFTSARAVNAVSFAIDSCTDLCVAKWRDKTNFSVGKATATLANSLLNFETLGSDSGNSENLCQFIIENCVQCEKPFIFPCSSIRKDTIPDTLSQSGMFIEEIICYETVTNAEFENVWKKLVLQEGLPEILIFFSPSGIHFCGKIIKDTYSNIANPKFVAIGPSTGKALLEANMTPFKIAEKPNPESVLCAVKSLLDT